MSDVGPPPGPVLVAIVPPTADGLAVLLRALGREVDVEALRVKLAAAIAQSAREAP